MPNQPWSVTWRKAIVSAPRLVPDFILRFTSPQGPQPLITALPSRGSHKIPVYIFVPPAESLARNGHGPDTTGPSQVPVMLDFHGGGFVLGSCQEQAPFCSKVCRELGCVVVSVDYRLGPYAKHPAALEDAEDVLRAVLEGEGPGPGSVALRRAVGGELARQGRDGIELDKERVGLSGFSSGGNLALNLVLNVDDGGASGRGSLCPFPKGYAAEIPVVLYYAAIDLRKLPSEREIIEGFHEIPKSFFASLQLEQYLMTTYLPRERVMEPRASPGLAEIEGGGGGVGGGGVHGKARFLMVLAEKDSLSGQNEVWAGRMAEAGRADHVVVQKFLGVVHGWTQFPDSWLDAGGLASKFEAHGRAVEFVRGVWKGEGGRR